MVLYFDNRGITRVVDHNFATPVRYDKALGTNLAGWSLDPVVKGHVTSGKTLTESSGEIK